MHECDQVDVLILANDSETMSGTERQLLLEAVHGTQGLRVASIRCNLPIDYDSREADRAHAELIYDKYPWRARPLVDFPNVMYSSEEYGPRIVEDFTELAGFPVEHRMVDLNRIAKPVSATEIRRNPVAHWEALRGPVRASLTKRVVVCGAESSGTTTLTRALAERYQTVWVPEYGRTFSEAVGNSHRWTSDDFIHIVDEQNRMEEDLARYAGPVMFCDTDGLATAMFHELYMKDKAPTQLVNVAMNWARAKSLYIVTDHYGVDFEDDGYRLFRHQRAWATEWFMENLGAMAPAPILLVTGSPEDRMDVATQAIDQIMRWDFGPAGDEL